MYWIGLRRPMGKITNNGKVFLMVVLLMSLFVVPSVVRGDWGGWMWIPAALIVSSGFGIFKDELRSLQTNSMIIPINRIWIIVMLAVIFLGLFYWFQFRPAAIKKDCYKALFDGEEGVVIGGSTAYGGRNEGLYNACLAKQGL